MKNLILCKVYELENTLLVMKGNLLREIGWDQRSNFENSLDTSLTQDSDHDLYLRNDSQTESINREGTRWRHLEVFVFFHNIKISI